MDTAIIVRDGAAPTEPTTSAMAYMLDGDSEGVMRRCFADLGYADGHVAHGSITTATEELGRRGSPRLLVVDVTGIADPMPQVGRLAEVCAASTEVIVVGERNDIVLYRDLKAAGVAEYFFKPLVSGVVNRVLGGIATGIVVPHFSRNGKLVIVLGMRGGVGATTIAVNAAWYIAEVRERRALLFDLNLQNGDAALQLDSKSSHTLREGIDHPERIDELFLERGVENVTTRLGLLASLEPLADPVLMNEEGVLRLLDKLLAHYRYVFVDLPMAAALVLPKLLHMPSTLLLVSDGSLVSARDVARWREKIGPNTPERSVMHILNKKGADGTMAEDDLLRALGQPPDIVIPYAREVAIAAALGAKAVQKCSAMQSGVGALSVQISGGMIAPTRSLWQRIFG